MFKASITEKLALCVPLEEASCVALSTCLWESVIPVPNVYCQARLASITCIPGNRLDQQKVVPLCLTPV